LNLRHKVNYFEVLRFKLLNNLEVSICLFTSLSG
jgi:hypothetical protein